MRVRDYATSQNSPFRIPKHGRALDRTGISARRRLYAQGETDFDLASPSENKLELSEQPVPPGLEPQPESASRVFQLKQIFPPSAACYETDDRSTPSVSSF